MRATGSRVTPVLLMNLNKRENSQCVRARAAHIHTRARVHARAHTRLDVESSTCTCARTKAEGYNVTANYALLATLIGFRGEGRAGGIRLMVYHLDLHNCSRSRDSASERETNGSPINSQSN